MITRSILDRISAFLVSVAAQRFRGSTASPYPHRTDFLFLSVSKMERFSNRFFHGIEWASEDPEPGHGLILVQDQTSMGNGESVAVQVRDPVIVSSPRPGIPANRPAFAARFLRA